MEKRGERGAISFKFLGLAANSGMEKKVLLSLGFNV